MQPTFVHLLARLKCRENDNDAIVGRTVRLYDADPLSDDFLSSGNVEQDDTAAFLFDLSLCQSLDSLFETKPDLFCVVAADDGRIIYRLTPSPNPEPAPVRESPCPARGLKGFSDEEATQCRADRGLASAG